MSTKLTCAWAFVMVIGACGDVDSKLHRVGGEVHGLWDHAQGVVLQLEAGSAHPLLTVSANGEFEFSQSLEEGTPYTVTVVTNPEQHTCVVDSGDHGVVADKDVINVSVACTGPVAAIEMSGAWGWTVDLTQDTQTFVGSVMVQDVALIVRGDSLTSVSVNDTSVTLGKQTAPISLPLGQKMVPVVLTAGELSKTYQFTFDRGRAALDQAVYGKASNTGMGDQFGYSVALSGDTLAVGAWAEASAVVGINGNQLDNNAASAGAVYVFVRSGTTWVQQAYLKASNTGVGDAFGIAIALSGDTLAVGAHIEDSAAMGVNGNQVDNIATNSGAVYVFVRNGMTWAQQAYLKASNTTAGDFFGYAVALSGNTLAVGAYLEDSASTSQGDNMALDAGAVYVFVRNGTTWTQQAYIKASNPDASDYFGYSVALFGDTLAVGARFEDSVATGINGNQGDNVASAAGAVYVFVRGVAGWMQQAYIKASNTGASDGFGYSVALSGDTLVVGAPGEDSTATGLNGDESNNTAGEAGAVYVFARSGTTWAQQAYLKPSNTGSGDQFGYSVALSGDTLAVGAYLEDSAATTVDGDGADNAAVSAGAAYVFVRDGTKWAQKAYVKASNTGPSDNFGFSVAVSGGTLAVGANLETSGAIGLNPVNGQRDNGTTAAGAVYLFR